MKCLFFMLFLMTSTSSYAVDYRQLSDPKQQENYETLTKELRCLVCQNQTIADSNAELAADLRRQVYEMLEKGQSREEIVQFMTDRYGDFVLYRPEVKALTWILWFGPFLLLLAGVVGMALYLRQRQAEQVQAEDQNLSEEERRRVAQLLKEGDAS